MPGQEKVTYVKMTPEKVSRVVAEHIIGGKARHRVHHRCGRALRKGERHMYRSHVMVCGGTGCTSSNSDKIAQAFEAEIQATGLPG